MKANCTYVIFLTFFFKSKYFLISHANITTTLAKIPPQIEKAKLFDTYGLSIYNNPSSELTEIVYVSIKLKADSNISHFMILTDSFIEIILIGQV